MMRTCFPSTPPALLTSSMAMSMPFLVEMPKVAVVPVKDPNSPMTISLEPESDFAPVHDISAAAQTKHKTNTQGLRPMSPPSARIPEEPAVWHYGFLFLFTCGGPWSCAPAGLPRTRLVLGSSWRVCLGGS